MKVTNALVKHLVEKLGLDKKHLDPATRVDAEVQKHASDKLISDELSLADLSALTAETEISAAQKSINDTVNAAVNPLAESMKALTETLTKAFSTINQTPAVVTSTEGAATKAADLGNAEKVLTEAATSESAPRVKGAHERYSTTKSVLTYKSSGNARNRKSFGDEAVLSPNGGVMETPSQLDNVIAKTWWKHLVLRAAVRQGVTVTGGYTDHDKSMLDYIVNNCQFSGPVGARSEDGDNDGAIKHLEGEKATGDLVKKGLLDGAASGGLEAVPIEFDNATIMTALLNGELFPLVNWRQTSRRRIEAYSMGEFSFTKETEGTAITLFDTSAFIAAFDTNIHPITGSAEMGLDFIDDAPNDVGGEVQGRWGDGFMKKMDGLIATGAGTDEITGLFTAAGTASPSATASSLPYSVSEAESLLFAVKKPYRSEAGARAVFVSNEVVYNRFRAIPVGTGDARRIYGMNYEDYMLVGHSHRINETIANTHCGFFCMNRFRGYRRRGFSVRIETGGKQLALSNQQLVVVRARFGGQLELGAAGAVIDDLPVS